MISYIGIDIAYKTFDVVVRQDNKNSKVETYNQHKDDHKKLINKLKKLKPESVVMEATGIYYLDLAKALFKADLPVSVINPKSFKSFAETLLKRSKTDSIDASLLAEYGQRMTPVLWTAPDDTMMELRDISRQINRLVYINTQAKNILHAMTATQNTNKYVIEDEKEGICFNEKRIERMRDLALELISNHDALKRQLSNITSATGIGENSAICMMGELNILPKTLKAPQVCHYAGLSVRLKQSGTSVNGPGRLSKAGNTYLRSAFFMPAMSASIHDSNAAAFKEVLLSRGKKKIQAICAIMRKYLMGVWACIKTDTPFDSSKLFSEEHKIACA